ncbi:hypothetical protein SNOG_06215 [Parastagonospora nodorum SN15]|uniref:Uncharacterized protein n=1 Tax=Phaeosphaeria nodorum (strain SN15 / ATCC MYA-4574 / FGSC 10173) TaxID=321614 RepID=Q0UPU9_PHANO|nr:hypothetical protein SNOG_06215 [Parastagonospora nodorum SN15]EAT86046.1 hypothetical protein SNOG_06215 [Parastagonospora nodorum SN15]
MQHLASLLRHDGDEDKPEPLCRFRELAQHAEVQLLILHRGDHCQSDSSMQVHGSYEAVNAWAETTGDLNTLNLRDMRRLLTVAHM